METMVLGAMKRPCRVGGVRLFVHQTAKFGGWQHANKSSLSLIRVSQRRSSLLVHALTHLHTLDWEILTQMVLRVVHQVHGTTLYHTWREGVATTSAAIHYCCCVTVNHVCAHPNTSDLGTGATRASLSLHSCVRDHVYSMTLRSSGR